VTDVTATLPAPDAPPAAAAPDGPIHVVSPFGVVGTVPASALALAQREGYTLATPEQVAARREQEQYGGGAHALGAVGAGAARALTFGLSDVALAEAGAQETLAAYRRVQPEATMLGEIGGTVAGLGGAAVAKGAGLAGQALRGAAAPTRAVLAAGEAVEAGAVAAGLGRVGGLTARAAAEGAAYGAAGAVTDAALGDHELTGERLFSAMGHGALLGGGAALGLAGVAGAAARAGRGAKGLVARVLRRPQPAEIEAVAARQFGEAAPGLGEAVAQDAAAQAAAAEAVKAPAGLGGAALKAYREAVILRTGAPREAVEALFAAGEKGAAARSTALYRAEELADDLSRGLRTDLDDAVRAYEHVSEAAKGGLKLEQIRRLIPESAPERTIPAMQTAFTEMREELARLRADPIAFGGAKRLKRLEGRVSMHERTGLAAADDAVRFIALDSAKREIGGEARTMMRAWGKHRRGEDLATHQALTALFERPRALLENGRVWSTAAADTQRTINAAWAAQIGGTTTGYVGSDRAFRRTFTTTEEGPWGLPVSYASPEKVDAYVRGVTSPTKDHAHIALKGWLASTEKFVQAAESVLLLTPEQVAAVARLNRARSSVTKRLAEGIDAATLANQAKALKAFDSPGLGIAGVAGGALLGGPAGAVAGAIVGGTGAPYATLKTLGSVEALQQRAAGSLEGRAVNWARGAERARRGIARITVPAVRIADEYDQRKRRVEAIATAPRDALREQAAAMAPQAPQIQASALATADRAAQYLTTALPAAVSRGLGPPRPPSRDEMEKWLRKARVVEDPASVVRDIEAGRLSRDGVDALRTVYPARYAALQRDLMTALAEQAGSPGGIQMPYQDRLQLGLLLDIPTDATLDPELMRAVQATYTPAAEAEQQAASKPRPQKAPNVAGHYADESERLEREE